MNLQKNFLGAIWAAGVCFSAVEQFPDRKNGSKNSPKIVLFAVLA